jgi:hypothetical protein
MKILYLDCFSGISGDMFIGALLDLGLDFDRLKDQLSSLPLSGYEISLTHTVKKGIRSTLFTVHHEEGHVHRHFRDIQAIIHQSSLDEWIKSKSIEVFRIIAEAEAKIHDQPVEKIHFHEVGAMDTILDIVGTMILMHQIQPEKIYASQVNVGGGMIDIAHGTYPVPAPATAEILKGIPVYSTGIQKELVTPTGAALLQVLVDEFIPLPSMSIKKIGYGAGVRNLEQPNVLRIFAGDRVGTDADEDEIAVLETSIDDMNPQYYDVLVEQLFSHRALDVFIQPIIMKKGRPGQQLTVLCKKEDLQIVQNILFTHSTSIGIRYRFEKRKFLKREIRTMDTPWGPARIKISYLHGEIVNIKAEYEDLRKISEKTGMSLEEVERRVLKGVSDK